MNELEMWESLKQKEDELDTLLKEAKDKALQIKENALQKAEEIRQSLSQEIEIMSEEHKKVEMEKIDKEVEIIKAAAVKKTQELRSAAEERLEKVVELVINHIVPKK